MFKKHLHYRPICARCGAQAVSPGSFHADHPDPLTVTDITELQGCELRLKPNGHLDVYDGELLCDGCADGRTPIPPGPEREVQLRRALTAGYHYTCCCDRCDEPVYDGRRGVPLALPEQFLDRLTANGLRDGHGWQISAEHAICSQCLPS